MYQEEARKLMDTCYALIENSLQYFTLIFRWGYPIFKHNVVCMNRSIPHTRHTSLFYLSV